MEPASRVESEEQILCSICQDVFTDPITTPCGHNYCKTCIKTDRVCVCEFCTESDGKEGKKIELGKTEAEVQQMIQERQVKIQEVQLSVEMSKEDADRERADSVHVFTALISCIECIEPRLIDVIEEKQKTTEKQADAFIKELQHEITELKQLSHTEDHLHPLQNFTSINTPPPYQDWTKVNVQQSSHVGTVRTSVAQLEKTLQEMEKLREKLWDELSSLRMENK